MTERYPDPNVRDTAASIAGKLLLHGLDENFGRQLISKSRQPHIVEWTPRDAAERFTDEDTLKKWYEAGKDVYVLTPGKKLAGMTWYEEKPMLLNTPWPMDNLPHHTFGIRIYEPYIGKGLTTQLMDASLQDYLATLQTRNELEDFRGIWLTTRYDNIARDIYSRYGYREVAAVDQRILMVLSVAKITDRVSALHVQG